ncbi:DUF932 domain-containing protein [uncultured Pseudonocardia sp.]|uniref:DUF932 domain-containing protein n=1 Tax=uncultured Pseudonocardia sp. TaxID=211455 RepID=UPI00261C96E7|nr:DUF932 domain-containing protein [uncultured Pseudonocardia sp.]
MNTSRPHQSTILTARNASLAELVELLRTQHAAKLDVVAPATDLHAQGGNLLVRGAGAPVLSMDGVSTGDALLRPTDAAQAGIADKLDIPLAYLRRCRREQVELYDANVNTWLAAARGRRFLVRGLTDTRSTDTRTTDTSSTDTGGGVLRGDELLGADRPDAGGGDGVGNSGGILRALLSDSFRIVDNLDVLLAVLAGIRDAGAAVDITAADLSERRMWVKVRSREITAQAPQLLAHYTSPFTGARGADNPVVFGGFLISNSETGQGKFTITPRLEVQVCENGLVLNEHALSEVHLGGRLPDGVIRWSADTESTALALVGKKARDAVAAFLDPAFVNAQLTRIQRDAGVEVTNPAATLEHVGKTLRFPTEVAETLLAHFIRGGDTTSGGVLQAVTSTAQTLADPDAAYQLEAHGLDAMSLAARHAHHLARA